MFNDYTRNRALDELLRKEGKKRSVSPTNFDMENSFSPKTGNSGIMGLNKIPSVNQILDAKESQKKLITDLRQKQWNDLSTGTDEIQMINTQNVKRAEQGLVDLDLELTAAYGLDPDGYWAKSSKTYGVESPTKAQDNQDAFAYARGTGGAKGVTDKSLQMARNPENAYVIGTGGVKGNEPTAVKGGGGGKAISLSPMDDEPMYIAEDEKLVQGSRPDDYIVHNIPTGYGTRPDDYAGHKLSSVKVASEVVKPANLGNRPDDYAGMGYSKPDIESVEVKGDKPITPTQSLLDDMFNAEGIGISNNDDGGGEREKDDKASEKITENAQNIIDADDYYGVDPKVVAGVIYTEQALNVNWVDVATDWLGATGVIDMSVGIGQVRMSTAEFVEQQGYMSEEIINENGLTPVNSRENDTSNRYFQLADDKTNCFYAAAYIKYFQDLWKKEYPDITEHPEILMTLYNLGHAKTNPNSEPHTNPFGDYAMDNYEEMGYLLGLE